MSHIHQQIRDYVATQLGAIGMFSGRVYKMRSYALNAEKLPAVVVYTNTQQSNPITIVKGASNAISDDLDAACVLVENVMGGIFDLNGLAKSCVLSTTEINVNVEGGQSVASAALVYAVDYVTLSADTETPA